MIKTLSLIAGAGLGAAMLYMLAPDKGKRRRELSQGKKKVAVNAGRGEINTFHNLSQREHEPRAQDISGWPDEGAQPAALAMLVKPDRSSTARRLRGAVGVALVLCYVVRRDPLGGALGVVGLGMLARRSLTRKDRKRLANVTDKHISRNEWLLISGFIPVAFFLRFLTLQSEDVVTPDGVYYATLGKNLISGNLKEGLSTYWPPLYPLLIGFSSLVFKHLEFAARFVSLLAGSLLVIPAYLLIRRLSGKEAASIGIFLITFYPPLMHYSTLVLTESTYTLIFVSALLSGMEALSSGKSSVFALTGFLFGACYLTKPEAIGYMGLLLLFLTTGTKLFRHGVPAQKLLLNASGLLSGFIVLSLPYILYINRETGRWTISDKLQANAPTSTDWSSRWFSLTEDGKTTLADRFYAGHNLKNASSRDLPAALLQPSNFPGIDSSSLDALKLEFSIIKDHILTRPMILLTGLGLFKAAAPEEIYLLLFVLATLIGYALFPEDVDARLLVPLIPILLSWASRGIVEFENGLIKWLEHIYSSKSSFLRDRNPLTPIILAALIFPFVPWLTELITTHHLGQAFEHKRVALWIKEHSKASPVIMAQGPWAAFYAEGRPVYLPTEEYAVVLEYARRNQVDLIVVDQSHRYPHLQFLFDEQSQYPELKLVYRYDEVPNRKALVLELRDSSEPISYQAENG